MTNKTQLSIIIVNFNTYLYLNNCLKSINQNCHGIKFEIIVVDNASVDNSPQKIKKYFPKVILIENKKNLGFSKANNQALNICNGEYVLLLNPDTIVDRDTIYKTLTFLRKNPLVGIVTCKVLLPSGKLDDACHRGFPTVWNAFCQFSGLASLLPHSLFFNGYHLGYQDLDKIHEIDSCAGAFMMIRKNAGQREGWFDEDYYWYGEDIDFCYRIKKEGFKIIFFPFASILHYKGVASGIKEKKAMYTIVDNKIKIIATKSRFAVMKTFYLKHYINRYPYWLKNIIFFFIDLKEKINLSKYK